MNEKNIKISRSQDPVLFFSENEKKRIMQTIHQAELKTSGEIRVHLERKAQADILKQAQGKFEKLGMTKTQQRNGVLIFLAVQSRQFVICGDLAIHEKLPETFWTEATQLMESYFKQDQFAEGIVHAVLSVGEKLRAFFPYERNDLNELSDEISYS